MECTFLYVCKLQCADLRIITISLRIDNEPSQKLQRIIRAVKFENTRACQSLVSCRANVTFEIDGIIFYPN